MERQLSPILFRQQYKPTYLYQVVKFGYRCFSKSSQADELLYRTDMVFYSLKTLLFKRAFVNLPIDHFGYSRNTGIFILLVKLHFQISKRSLPNLSSRILIILLFLCIIKREVIA